jgi:hypothetical protein
MISLCSKRVNVLLDADNDELNTYNLYINITLNISMEVFPYGRQALNRECDNIWCATSWHTQVYTSTRNIGEFVAGGKITESDVRTLLEDAGRQSGLTKAKGPEKT